MYTAVALPVHQLLRASEATGGYFTLAFTSLAVVPLIR